MPNMDSDIVQLTVSPWTVSRWCSVLCSQITTMLSGLVQFMLTSELLYCITFPC